MQCLCGLGAEPDTACAGNDNVATVAIPTATVLSALTTFDIGVPSFLLSIPYLYFTARGNGGGIGTSVGRNGEMGSCTISPGANLRRGFETHLLYHSTYGSEISTEVFCSQFHHAVSSIFYLIDFALRDSYPIPKTHLYHLFQLCIYLLLPGAYHGCKNAGLICI